MTYMKTLKIILLLTLTSQLQNVFAQNKTYFDKDWKPTTKEHADYYRLTEKKSDSLYYVKDFHLNGVLQMDGNSTSLEKDIFQGTVNWYNPDGSKSTTRNFNQGILEGTYIDYTAPKIATCEFKNNRAYNGVLYTSGIEHSKYSNYKNGILTHSYTYYKDSDQVAVKTDYFYKKEFGEYYPIKEMFYDKTNQIIGTIHYSKKHPTIPQDGIKYTFYLEENQIVAVKSKTNYINGFAEGKTIAYHKNGKKWLKGTYKNRRKYQGEFLEETIKSRFKNGIQTEKIKYDKDFNIVAKLTYKNNKPYQGTEYDHTRITTYNNGQLQTRKDYYDYKLKQLKKETNCVNKTCTVKWYNKQGGLLGKSVGKNNTIIDGLIIYHNKLTNYSNGRKEGVEKEYKTDSLNELVAQTLYKNDTIIWKKTKIPLADDFFHCDYKDNKPYQGAEYTYKRESHYEKGKLTKKISYREIKKSNDLTIDLIQFYDTTARREAVNKEIKYVNGKEYTIIYKNHAPYNGISWRLNVLYTYENGKKEGIYQIYTDDINVVVEEGNYIDDKIQGTVKYTPIPNKKYPFLETKPTVCEFIDNKPFNGTISTLKETSTYVNGKKQGVCLEYYSIYEKILLRKISYTNSIKEGKEITYLIDNQKIEGINKEDKPFSGSFYNLKKNTIETYIEGKKHGLFTTFNDHTIKQAQEFDKGKLLSEKTWYIKKKTDSLIGKGYYKNNKPYLGTFVKKQKAYRNYLIVPYKKGKENGVKKTIYANHNGVKVLEEITYKNDEKQKEYRAKYKLNGKLKTIKGVYKNSQPYQGEFITKNEEKLVVISFYRKGIKEGYEKNIHEEVIDSLLYKKGKIVEGVQYEVLKGAYFKTMLKHFYKAGKKYKTLLREDITINYTEDGFTIEDIGHANGYDKINALFSDKSHRTGTITYSLKNTKVGEFNFKEGRLLNGELKSKRGRFVDELETKVKDEVIEITIKTDKKYKIYEMLFLPNKIPNTLTYKNHQLLLDGFLDFFNVNLDVTSKQYLLDGTLISESKSNSEKKSGTYVKFKEIDGKIVYSINHYKKNDKTIRIEGLSLDEVLQESQRIKE